MALNRRGINSVATLRQPSAGLYFSRKGGGTGGGKACLVPQEDIEIHCTGDFHAVTLAHNLISAHIDNLIFRKRMRLKELYWKRAIDLCDRALRHTITGMGIKDIQRNSGFIMTPASELMSVISLIRDMEGLKEKISRIIVGIDNSDAFVRLGELKIENQAIRIISKVLFPNLVSTCEYTPVLLHTGPFSNISHGNSSVIADEIAMRLAEYVVTEGGGGTDTGLEKFLSIKFSVLKRIPDAVVMVVTARALKMHGLASMNRGVVPSEDKWYSRNDEALERGGLNMERHIENIKNWGFPLVVAINRFSHDSNEEIKRIKNMAMRMGADFVVVHNGWSKGSQGASELVDAVIEASRKPFKFRKHYSDDQPLKVRLSAIAKKIYGASEIEISGKAEAFLKRIKSTGHENLPICIAKTHLSLSHDSRIKNVPARFRLPIKDFIPYAGAGYICGLTENINLMPGMPEKGL
jgi:formate--tetrahydrofolate ligase